MRHDPHDRVERTRCAGDSIEDVLERYVASEPVVIAVNRVDRTIVADARVRAGDAFLGEVRRG